MENSDVNAKAPADNSASANRRRRTPFTNLSQVDADLALARTLQEQERANMMLTRGAGSYGRWGYEGRYVVGNGIYEDDDASEEDYDGSDVEVDDEEEDAFDAQAHGEGKMIGEEEDDEDESVDEDGEGHDRNHPDTWGEVDPNDLSYELIALGEVVGTEGRGLSADTIASLASIKCKSQDIRERKSDSCVICRLDYEDGDMLTILSCKHSYHPECINNWLQINKVCPVCSTEVSTPPSEKS